MPCYRPNSAPVGPRAGTTFRPLPRSPARAAPDSSAPQPPGVHERDEPIGSHRWQTFGHPLRRERAGRRFRRRPVFVSAPPLAGDGTRPRSGLDRTGQRGPHGADREETDRRRAALRPCRTARLDLDNINNDTQDGLHITSMAGSWLAIVQGFAGMRTLTGELHFAPQLPSGWDGYAFKIVVDFVQFFAKRSSLYVVYEKDTSTAAMDEEAGSRIFVSTESPHNSFSCTLVICIRTV